MAEEFDYVIVGAGAAGSVLAERLSRDEGVTVLVLEAGASDRHPFVFIPAGFVKTFRNPRFNWNDETEPDENVNGRRIHFPQGKGLGGSTSINGHLWVRGQPLDYDGWAQRGARGWSWADVEPWFRAIETRPGGDPDVRGQDGPMHVSDPGEKHPLCRAFIEGAAEVGLPVNPDYNGPDQEGVGWYQRTIRNGRRWSAADAYLRPAMRRTNVRVETRAIAERIIFENGRATGLRWRRGGSSHVVKARVEVILSAGALRTPQLLQVSGVGDPEDLAAIGVEPVLARREVGKNLQDHYAARVTYRVKAMKTLNERASGPSLAWEIARWFANKQGLLAFSPAHVAGFAKSEPHLETPDLQFVFSPASYSEGVARLEREPGMTSGFWQLRPESRGWVRARSANIADAPSLQPAYLQAETDRRTAIAGVRWCRALCGTAPLSPYRDMELMPGAEVRSDDEILDYVRERGATVHHAMGTCRMGTDPEAVVDERLRLRGMNGIRVIDASVMPAMPSANTNAATLMIAARAAEMVVDDRNAARTDSRQRRET